MSKPPVAAIIPLMTGPEHTSDEKGSYANAITSGHKNRNTDNNCVKTTLSVLVKLIWADKIDLILSLIVIIITGVLAYVFKYKDIGLQAYMSFDVNDKSLSYDHIPSNIPGNVNIIITTLYLVVCYSIRSLSLYFSTKDRQIYKIGCIVWGILFIFMGSLETNFLTNASKTMIGNLKPYFLQECNVDKSLLPSGETWVNQNLTRTICQHAEDLDYRRSFPSGHASQAWFCTAFAILEIQHAPNSLSGIVKRLCQLVVFFYAILISAFRIKGHHHHWYDVLAGLVLGCFVGASSYCAKHYKLKHLEKKLLNTQEPDQISLNIEMGQQ